MVDVPQIKRESQVEYKKKEQLPDLGQKRLRRKETNAERSEKFESTNEENASEEENSKIDAVLVKQIEYALRKEEFQPEIMKLKWISFLTYAALIVITSILFSLFISNTNSTRENLKMITDLHQLIANVITGIYFNRELVLYNNEKFTNYLFEKEYSITNITSQMEELFKNSYTLQQSILTTSTTMHDNRTNLLLEGTTYVYMIEDNLLIKSSVLSSTFISEGFISKVFFNSCILF